MLAGYLLLGIIIFLLVYYLPKLKTKKDNSKYGFYMGFMFSFGSILSIITIVIPFVIRIIQYKRNYIFRFIHCIFIDSTS
jgi:hypothetical protein